MKLHANKKHTAFVIGVITAVCILSFASSPTQAQDSSQKLQVSPVRHILSADPGETLNFDFKFFNLGDAPVVGLIKSADFIVTDDEGTPKILDLGDQVLPKFSAASWTDLPFDRMSVPANDSVPVRITINVPQNARPGGRYVAIYFEPTSADVSLSTNTEAAGSSISQRIAGLVYLRINGPITEKALISRLIGPSFLEYGPISIDTEILNRGDYHIRPRGSIKATSLLKTTIDQKKIEEVNIFPETARSYKFELGKKWMLGKYMIEITASYGESGQVIQRSLEVWVFPWKIALVVLLALVILMLLIRTLLKKNGRQKELETELQEEHEEIRKLREEVKKS